MCFPLIFWTITEPVGRSCCFFQFIKVALKCHPDPLFHQKYPHATEPGVQLNTEQCSQLRKKVYDGSVARNSLVEIKKNNSAVKKKEKEKRNSRKVSEALIWLWTWWYFPPVTETDRERSVRWRAENNRFRLQYGLHFYVLFARADINQRGFKLWHERGVLKVNLCLRVLRGSIVLSCFCNFMDFSEHEPLAHFFSFLCEGGEGCNQLNKEVRWALQLDY